MKITRSFGEYFKYSLHDARVQKIEYADDKLIFTFDYIFSYEHGDEQTHKAKIVFEKCDIDDLEILVFNSTMLDTFTGKRIELPQYQQEYSESEFEVITETYNWGSSCTPRLVMDRRGSCTLYNEHILHRRYVIYN